MPTVLAQALARGAGIQPIAVHPQTGEIYLLLGQEQDLGNGWYDSGKYAGFGGKIEAGETPAQCAAREGYEETMGVLGTRADIAKMISKKNLFAHAGYYMYIVVVPYDEELPTLFANVYEYFAQCKIIDKNKYKSKNKAAACPLGLFEKRALKWLSLSDLTGMLETQNGINGYRRSFINSMYALSQK